MNQNFFHWSFRAQYLLGFVVCAVLIGFALYAQIQWGLQPCPLCILQRIVFTALAIVFFLGGLHAPTSRIGRSGYGAFAFLIAVIGMAISGRHVWLQHLPPDQVPSCGPGLNYLLEAMPLAGVVRKVLTGSGECAKVDWSFVGLSMPAWSLLWFTLLAAWALFAVLKRR